MTHILAIDQGTTSSRAILFDAEMRPSAVAQKEFNQHFPASGWVEHDPEEIWETVCATCLEAAEGQEVAAIGITNQRETTLVWDRVTGAPIYNAIVWQDRRTAQTCAGLKAAGHEAMVTDRTGLLLDPYFSATKLAWILDNVDGARAKAEAGELAFGTVDTFLIWRLTDGASHVTDATNAARTMLYDIKRGAWDADICALLNIPMNLLPRGARLRVRVRRDRPIGCASAHSGRGGGSAGGDHRAGVFPAGDAEIHLWHRLLCAAEHGRCASCVKKSPADHDCLSAGRQADLCVGGLDLYRGCCGAVAARRAGDHRRCG